MSEEALTVTGAVKTIQDLGGLRDALRRRTSGVTWMIWGLATMGIFVTYDFLGFVGASASPGAMGFMPFAWIPWVAMGVLATRALWDSAGMVMPGLGNRRAGVLRGLLFFGLSMFAFWIVWTFHLPFVEPAIFMAVVGLGSVGFAVTGFACIDSTERALQGAGGTLLVLLGLVPSFLMPSTEVAYAFFSVVAPLAVGIVYFGIGMMLAVRG